jgi:hypothetical protein
LFSFFLGYILGTPVAMRRVDRIGESSEKVHGPVDAFRRGRVGMTQRRPCTPGEAAGIVDEPCLTESSQRTDENLQHLAIQRRNGSVIGRPAR